MKNILVLLFTILSLNAFSSDTYFCKDSLETLPILQGGRVKPLYVHANEVMKQLTGKSKAGKYSSVTGYCLLSLQGMGLTSDVKLDARVDHIEVMEYLGLKENEHSISYDDLINHEDGKIRSSKNR